MDIFMAAALLPCLYFADVPPLQTGGARRASQQINAPALWQPGMVMMQTLKDQCGSAPNFGECFAAQMGQSDASPQAVAFTKPEGNGKALIAMKYVRPWEKNTAPAKSTICVVDVE